MKKILFPIILFFIQIFAFAQTEDILFLGQKQDGYASNNTMLRTSSAALDTIPSIKYETQVNPAGAFTVNVPIEVPKGRGSLQPNLALGYNSQSNIGNVGFGWNLIGISSISRGGKSKTIDGNNDGPQNDNTDPYYFDGERLIEISPNNFVTEKYSKIIITKATSGIYSFIVKYTDGKIAKYRELVSGQHYIVEMIDAFDNIVTYSYHQGQNYWKLPLLQFVNYHGGQIEFFYVNRNKANNIYRNGIENKIDYMYHSFVVRYQDGNNQYHLYRKYHLFRDIMQNGNSERLYKIEVENANGDFLRPLILKYNNENIAGFNLELKNLNYSRPFNPNSVHKNFNLGIMAMGDFFGKGELNLLYRINNGIETKLFSPNYGYFNYIDSYINYNDVKYYSGKVLRGNEITDKDQLIIQKTEYSGDPVVNSYSGSYTPTTLIDHFSITFKTLFNNAYNVFHFNLPGVGRVESKMIQSQYGYTYEQFYWKRFKDNYLFLIQDFNNDGLVDLLIISKEVKKVLFVEIGKKCNNDDPLNFIELNQLEIGTGYTYPNFSKIELFEIDGDGRVELMFIHDTNKYSVFKIDLANQRLKPIPTMQNITLQNFGTDSPMIFGDYNGDGLTDFMTPDTIYDINISTVQQVIHAINNHYLGWKRYTSTGTSFIVTQEDFSQQKIAYIKPSQGEQSVSAIHNKKFTWKGLWGGDIQTVVSETDYGTSNVFAMDINNDGKSDLVCLKKFGRVKIEQPTDGDYFKYSFSNRNGYCSGGGPLENGICTALGNSYGSSIFYPYQNVNNITFHINDPTTDGTIRFTQHPQLVDLKNQLMSPFSVFIPTSDFNYLHTYKPGFIFHDAMLNSKLYEFNLKNFQEGLITKIEDGTQNYSKVEYSQMLRKTQEYDNATYKTKPHNLNYPYFIHQNNPQHYLVNKLHTCIKLDNSSLSILTKEYRYENATQHLDGKGFLGFQRTFSSDVYESKLLQDGRYLPKDILKPIFWTINTYDPLLDNTLAQITYGSLAENAVFSKMETKYQKFTKPNNRYLILSTSEHNKDFLKDVTISKSYEYDTANDFLLKKTITNYNATVSTIEEYQYRDAFFNGNHYFFGRIKEVKNTAVRDGSIFTTKEETFYNTDGTVQETKKYGHNTPAITNTYTYFPYGELQSETLNTIGMPTPLTTSYLYDTTQRFLHKSTTPDGLISTRNVTPLGWITSEISPLGHTTTYQHDNWGNVHTAINYLGIKTKTKRLLNIGGVPGSYRISQKTDHAPETITIFDSRDLALETKTETLNGQWVFARKEYDLFGKTLRSSQPFFEGETIKWDVSEYDEMNRLTKFTTHNGRVMTTCYEKLTVTVQDGHRKHSRTVDATGQTIKHTDAGGSIFYKYHPNGSLKETNYDGIKTTIKIDGWGNKTELNDPSAGIYKYEYDNLSRIKKETNPKNGITTYTYDNYGRPLTEIIVSTSESTNISKNFEYHPTTFLPTKIKGTSNGAYYEYETLYHDPITGVPDPHKRIRGKKETTPHFVNESYTTYDLIGRVDETTQKTRVIVNNNFTTETKIKNIYNNLSILTEQKDVTLNRQIWKINTINARGQVTNMQYGNGFIISNTYNANTYSLEEIKHQRGSTTPIMFLKYQYNVVKGVLDKRENVTFGKTEIYQYDDLDRLLKETVNSVITQEYTYDKRGRITSNTALGQYDYVPNSYKLNGVQYNTAGQSVNTNRGFAQISYNAFKNPNEVFLANKDRISYDYGILKTRAVAYYGSLNTNKLSRPNRKYFSSDKTVEIVKIGTQTKVITYLTGDPYSANYMKIDVLSGNTFVSKTNYFLHRDNQGTILALSHAVTGENVEQRYFDAWGNLKEAKVNGINTAINTMGWVTTPPLGVGGLLIDRGYTGHEHLTTVGLIHMNGRIYDPILHQFMSPDNYVQDQYNTQNFNRFGYVLNNPLLYNDPSGEVLVPILIGAAIGILTTAISNISNGIPFWQGIGKAGVIGAMSGTISLGIGNIAKTTFKTVLAQSAMKAGLTGFSSGILTSLSGGDFGTGFISGFISSAVSSAIEYGVDKIEQEVVFKKGVSKLGVKPGDAVPQTDEFIAKAKAEWFPDAPKEALVNHSVEKVPEKIKEAMEANNANACATPQLIRKDGVLSYNGKGSIYYNPNGKSFSSARQLFTDMGHELVHISQYSVFANMGITYDMYLSSSENGTREILELMEYRAYTFQFENLSPSETGGFHTTDDWNDIISKYSELHKALDISTNPVFSWTKNLNFNYPLK